MTECNEKEALDMVNRLYMFLQGEVPDGYRIPENHMPKLNPEQAWTAVWFIQNEYFEYPDHIEKCDVCGEIYDSWKEGDSLDFADSPYFFCDNCIGCMEYQRKKRIERKLERSYKKRKKMC